MNEALRKATGAALLRAGKLPMGKPLATGPKMSTPSNIPDTDKPCPLGINPYSKDLDSPESPDLSVSTPPQSQHTTPTSCRAVPWCLDGVVSYVISYSTH